MSAIEAYKQGFPHSVIWLGSLPPLENQWTIEYAIRRYLKDQEVVGVFWPYLWDLKPDFKHDGWCHVLCQSPTSTKNLIDALTGTELYPEFPQPCKALQAVHPITIFQRIRHIQNLGPHSRGLPGGTQVNAGDMVHLQSEGHVPPPTSAPGGVTDQSLEEHVQV